MTLTCYLLLLGTLLTAFRYDFFTF